VAQWLACMLLNQLHVVLVGSFFFEADSQLCVVLKIHLSESLPCMDEMFDRPALDLIIVVRFRGVLAAMMHVGYTTVQGQAPAIIIIVDAIV